MGAGVGLLCPQGVGRSHLQNRVGEDRPDGPPGTVETQVKSSLLPAPVPSAHTGTILQCAPDPIHFTHQWPVLLAPTFLDRKQKRRRQSAKAISLGAAQKHLGMCTSLSRVRKEGSPSMAGVLTH